VKWAIFEFEWMSTVTAPRLVGARRIGPVTGRTKKGRNHQ
jgi:hypothetical protein